MKNSILNKRSFFPKFVTWATILFFYIPLIVVAVNSFNLSKGGGLWKGFTLKWYAQLFSDARIWEALRNTLVIATTATLIATVLGTLCAFALHRYQNKLQKIHYMLVYLPLIVPDILSGISMLLLFVLLFSWLNPFLSHLIGFKMSMGMTTIIIAHITFCLSYVAMVVLGRLQDFDFSLYEAALDLGANKFQAFVKVVIPALMPGILAGALLAFTISLDDYVITFFVAGKGSLTLPIYIYGSMKHGNPAVINALSVILLILTFITVYIAQKLLENKDKK
jgi:spermidine/putrescine transport system permease protein